MPIIYIIVAYVLVGSVVICIGDAACDGMGEGGIGWCMLIALVICVIAGIIIFLVIRNSDEKNSNSVTPTPAKQETGTHSSQISSEQETTPSDPATVKKLKSQVILNYKPDYNLIKSYPKSYFYTWLPHETRLEGTVFEKFYKPFYRSEENLAVLYIFARHSTELEHPFVSELNESTLCLSRDEQALAYKYPWLVFSRKDDDAGSGDVTL